MAQADFSYAAVGDAAGLSAYVSVFSDRPYLREQIGDDLRGAGFQTVSYTHLTLPTILLV